MRINAKHLSTKGVNARQVSYKAGSPIFYEKDLDREMYFIESGRVEITKIGLDKEIVLTILSPGEYFGEMAAITGRPRSAGARALDDCKLRVLDEQGFREALKASPEFALDVMATLTRRLECAARG